MASYKPGGVYTIEVPSYSDGPANMWIHSTAGTMEPMDATTHTQAKACTMAAYSNAPLSTHMYKWTAPAGSDVVTFSAAMADGKTSAYNTNTVRPHSLHTSAREHVLLCTVNRPAAHLHVWTAQLAPPAVRMPICRGALLWSNALHEVLAFPVAAPSTRGCIEMLAASPRTGRSVCC